MGLGADINETDEEDRLDRLHVDKLGGEEKNMKKKKKNGRCAREKNLNR